MCVLLFLPLTAFSQLQESGTLDPVSGYGPLHTFTVPKPGVYDVIVEGKGFEPVLSVFPPFERGGEWDGSHNGVLEYSTFFHAPGTVGFRVRANLTGKTEKLTYTLLMVEIAVPPLSVGETKTLRFDGPHVVKGGVTRSIWFLVTIRTPGMYKVELNAPFAMRADLEGVASGIGIYGFINEAGKAYVIPGEIIEPGVYALRCMAYEERTEPFTVRVTAVDN